MLGCHTISEKRLFLLLLPHLNFKNRYKTIGRSCIHYDKSLQLVATPPSPFFPKSRHHFIHLLRGHYKAPQIINHRKKYANQELSHAYKIPKIRNTLLVVTNPQNLKQLWLTDHQLRVLFLFGIIKIFSTNEQLSNQIYKPFLSMTSPKMSSLGYITFSLRIITLALSLICLRVPHMINFE